jgi:hypothetical protein
MTAASLPCRWLPVKYFCQLIFVRQDYESSTIHARSTFVGDIVNNFIDD